MRVIVVFSDHERYIPRPRMGDICIIAREEKEKIQIKAQCLCKGFNAYNIPLLDVLPSSEQHMNEAKKINVEIIGHSSKGGKSIQSDVTKNYPLQNIALDDLVLWLEYDLLKNNTSRSTITLLSCEAADGKNNYPPVAEQMFALFQKKPEKLTARMGFGFIEKNIFSLSTFELALKTAMDHINNNKEDKDFIEKVIFPILRTYNSFFPYTTTTNVGEKFAYFEGYDGQSYSLDKQLYDLFYLMKRLNPHPENSDIKTILEKEIINVQPNEFIILAKFGIKYTKYERLYAKSELVLAASIKGAKKFNVNLSDYQLKQNWINSLDALKQDVQANNRIKYQEELIVFLDKTIDFIKYRHPRNYQINNLNDFIEALIKIAANNGTLTAEYRANLIAFKDYIASSDGVNSDSVHRCNAVGLRFPSYYETIKRTTETKNKEFSVLIKNFIEKIDEASIEEVYGYPLN